MKKLMYAGLFMSIGVFGQPTADKKSQSSFTLKPTGNMETLIVNVENLFSDLEFIGTSDAEIRIIAEGYKGLPEKAAGLKPLSAIGEENTGIGLYAEQEGNIITIAGTSNQSSKADYIVYLPKMIKLKVDYNSFRAGDVMIKGMTNEVAITSKIGDLIFEDVTGPIVAHTLSADIEVVFTTLNQANPTSLTSTSGDIDITLPAPTTGDFKMSTTSGEVYTDMDFEFGEEEGLKRWGGGMSANATLGGGGVSVMLRSVSGDIYIRKKG